MNRTSARMLGGACLLGAVMSCAGVANLAQPDAKSPAAPAAKSGSGDASRCPSVRSAGRIGTVEDPHLDEISGLVFSRRDDGVLFVHNDSGDGARIYAIETSGRLVAQLNFSGIEVRDIEDIAVGDRFLYVGDIGDNKEKRESVRVHRFLQPKLADEDVPVVLELAPPKTLTLVYPDRAHDAETLLVDPRNESVIIVTKARKGPTLVLSSGPRPWLQTGPVRLIEVARIELGWSWFGPSRLATGGDISPDGSWIAVRTYTHVYLFERRPSQSAAQALGRRGCATVLQLEPQGEAIAFDASNRALWTVSEGKNQPIRRYVVRGVGNSRHE